MFLSQIFGHQRSPSVEWKELTKRDAQDTLALDLDRLLRTAEAGAQERLARSDIPDMERSIMMS